MALLMGFSLTDCTNVGKFYTRRIRPASYYVNRYCFEIPQSKINGVVGWMLRKYNFPVVTEDRSKGLFVTKPVYMERYSRNPDWGYKVALRIKVSEEKGKLDLKGVPVWALKGKNAPKMPPYPKRADFKTREAYFAAQEAHNKKQTQLLELSAKGFKLLKQWEGCNIHSATLRTIVEVKASFRAYPLGAFDTLSEKGSCQITSDNSLEHSIIRVIAWRLGRLKFVPVMMYDRRPRWRRGAVCKAPKPKATLSTPKKP